MIGEECAVNNNDWLAGERLLRRNTQAAILRFARGITEHSQRIETLSVQNVTEFRRWLRSSKPGAMPKCFLLAVKEEFDTHRQIESALARMKASSSHVLSSSQDQIVVLDREQRMVAFLGPLRIVYITGI
jgi:hypothetical protein